jgi:hypothetical protein
MLELPTLTSTLDAMDKMRHGSKLGLQKKMTCDKLALQLTFQTFPLKFIVSTPTFCQVMKITPLARQCHAEKIDYWNI